MQKLCASDFDYHDFFFQKPEFAEAASFMDGEVFVVSSADRIMTLTMYNSGYWIISSGYTQNQMSKLISLSYPTNRTHLLKSNINLYHEMNIWHIWKKKQLVKQFIMICVIYLIE